MANWQGPSHTKEERGEDVPGARPRRAYFMQRVDGSWTLGVGDPTEADAVPVLAPIGSAPGMSYLDDDLAAANQRQPLLLGDGITVIL